MIVLLAMALAAAPDHQIRCDVVDAGQPVRHFTVAFVADGAQAKRVKVVETDRIFTPGNVVASWSTRGGGTMTTMPAQRPGKWSGAADGQTWRFTLAARDGSAGFVLTPDAAKPGSYGLTWTAELADPRFGDAQSASGAGTCTELTS